MTALVERTALANASPRQGVFSALVAVGSRARRAEVVHHLAALGGNELVEAGSIAEARVRAMADRATRPGGRCTVPSRRQRPWIARRSARRRLASRGRAVSVGRPLHGPSCPGRRCPRIPGGARRTTRSGPTARQPAQNPADGGTRPLRPRDRGAPAGCGWPLESRHRWRARTVRADGEEPPGPNRPEAGHRGSS